MEQQDREPWIVAADSPQAAGFVDVALSVHPDATVICSNGAVHHCRRLPNYFFLFDMGASHTYCDIGKTLQVQGAKLVTLNRAPTAIKTRGVDHFDIFLAIDGRDTGKYVRGVNCDCGFSRLYIVQFALNSGASHVILAGHEGYPDEYHPQACAWREYCGRWMQSAVDACPDVRFEFLGTPRYPLAGASLEIYSTVNDYREVLQCA